MSTATNVGTTITSVLTVGVGGLVAWSKKYITNILNEASALRKQATEDIKVIKADVVSIENELKAIATAVTPAPKASRRAPATKATTTQKTTTTRKAGR